MKPTFITATLILHFQWIGTQWLSFMTGLSLNIIIKTNCAKDSFTTRHFCDVGNPLKIFLPACKLGELNQNVTFLYLFKLLICMHKKDHFTAMGLFINAQFWRSESDVFLFLGLHSELPWHFFLHHVHRQHTDHWLYRRNHRLLGCPEWRGGKSVRLQWYEKKHNVLFMGWLRITLLYVSTYSCWFSIIKVASSYIITFYLFKRMLLTCKEMFKNWLL